MMTRILEGFRVRHANIVQGRFGRWPLTGCGLTAACDTSLTQLEGRGFPQDKAARVLRVSPKFASGFINGWDGDQAIFAAPLQYVEGYAYGALCYRAAVRDLSEGRTRPLRHPKSARQVAVERATLRGVKSSLEFPMLLSRLELDPARALLEPAPAGTK